MLEISWRGSDQRFIDAMRAKGPRIISVLTTRLTILMQLLQSYIQSQKLSGQVLQVRTGHLRSSVEAQTAKIEGTTITGQVLAGGGPAFYGAIFEFGEQHGGIGTWVVPVKARALMFLKDGQKVFASRVLRPQLAARPFMAPSLEENAANIEDRLRGAVDEALNE